MGLKMLRVSFNSKKSIEELMQMSEAGVSEVSFGKTFVDNNKDLNKNSSQFGEIDHGGR